MCLCRTRLYWIFVLYRVRCLFPVLAQPAATQTSMWHLESAGKRSLTRPPECVWLSSYVFLTVGIWRRKCPSTSLVLRVTAQDTGRLRRMVFPAVGEDRPLSLILLYPSLLLSLSLSVCAPVSVAHLVCLGQPLILYHLLPAKMFVRVCNSNGMKQRFKMNN